MRRREMKDYKKIKGSKELGSEEAIVQKTPGNYKTRYKGLVSPKKDIVEDQYQPSYKSRYN